MRAFECAKEYNQRAHTPERARTHTHIHTHTHVLLTSLSNSRVNQPRKSDWRRTTTRAVNAMCLVLVFGLGGAEVPVAALSPPPRPPPRPLAVVATTGEACRTPTGEACRTPTSDLIQESHRTTKQHTHETICLDAGDCISCCDATLRVESLGLQATKQSAKIPRALMLAAASRAAMRSRNANIFCSRARSTGSWWFQQTCKCKKIDQ